MHVLFFSKKLNLFVNGQPLEEQNLPTFDNPQINSLLIFDTVGAFGSSANNIEEARINPDTGRWDTDDVYNLSIPPNVVNVRHAIAYNELRYHFPLTSAIDPGNPNDPRIVERAFEGVHTDIGCCYQDDDSLARDALFWMWNEAKNINVPLDALPPEYMPTPPHMKKPLLTQEIPVRVGRDPGGYTRTIKRRQQGSRSAHDSRYNPLSKAPRNVFYLRNPSADETRAPRYFDTVKGPEHFNFMQEIYGEQYLFNAEEAYQP